MKTQSNNKRNNRLITYKNITLNAKQWSDKLNIPYPTIKSRIRNDWTDDEIVTTPYPSPNREKRNNQTND